MTSSPRHGALLTLLGNAFGLWRSLTPRNPFHRAIAGTCALLLLAILSIQLSRGADPVKALLVSANGAVMVLLAWAVARELDPDAPVSALVAAAVGAAMLLGGSAPAPAMVALLASLRIVTQSTGKAPTPVDLAALPVLAAAAASTPGGWIGGAALAAALLADGFLRSQGSAAGYGAAAAALAAALGVAMARDTLNLRSTPPSSLEWAVGAAILIAFTALRRYEPQSVQDRSSSRITPNRLEAGRRLALGSAVGSLALFGPGAVPLLSGAFASLLGIAINDRLIPGSVASRRE